MAKYLMSLDQGTTSSRCNIFDRFGNIVATDQKEFTNYFPMPGWVEHDASEIWRTQSEVALNALEKSGLAAADIEALGITNQRETTVVWDKKTGKPVYRAIVWQCRRTADYCDELKKQGLSEMIRDKTGLLIDSYFSATKIRWILDHVEGARKAAENGELLCGTIDSWLIYNLTGGRVHATDTSNACRTMLFDIRKLKWDKELLKLFDIPECMMPEVLPSSGIFGYTDKGLFGSPVPIAGVAGDQQAALFGQCCFDEGNVKNTYGTGGFMLMNTGTVPVKSQNGLLTSVAWTIGDKTVYALEGSVFVCGAAVQWLRDGLEIVASAPESEKLASKVDDSGGVYFVPAFVGLGAPYWDPYARGAFFGLTRQTNRSHLARATLEAMAYQTFDILKLMEKESASALSDLRVDGGASANNLLVQFQSDILGIPAIRPKCIETTSLGAANLAGLATGLFSSLDDIKKTWQVDKIFKPSTDEEKRKEMLDGWHEAVRRTLGWSKK